MYQCRYITSAVHVPALVHCLAFIKLSPPGRDNGLGSAGAATVSNSLLEGGLIGLTALDLGSKPPSVSSAYNPLFHFVDNAFPRFNSPSFTLNSFI